VRRQATPGALRTTSDSTTRSEIGITAPPQRPGLGPPPPTAAAQPSTRPRDRQGRLGCYRGGGQSNSDKSHSSPIALRIREMRPVCLSVQLELGAEKRLHCSDGSFGRCGVITGMRSEFDARIGVREGLAGFRIYNFAQRLLLQQAPD
jgi:hypothetical protein